MNILKIVKIRRNVVSSIYSHLNDYIVLKIIAIILKILFVVDAEFRALIKPFARMQRNARIMFRFVRNAILSRERVSDRNIITGGFHSPKMSASHGVKINETPPEPLEREERSSLPFLLTLDSQLLWKCARIVLSHDYINIIWLYKSYNNLFVYLRNKRKFNVTSFDTYFVILKS